MQNEIQVGRFNAILSKLTGITGAPSPVMATDVFPMLALEVDRPEWSFLGGERLGWMRWTDAAVAANYSSVGIRNPANSGVLVVIERIEAHISAAGQWFVGVRANTTVDASGTCLARDSRFVAAGYNTTAQYVERTQATQPAYPAYGLAVAANNTISRHEVPIVLSPGYEVMVWPQTVNVAIYASFAFRERILNSSETR